MNIIGRTIANRYEIINKTGVGGMATVYMAKDKVLNRNVAIKVLKDEFTTDDEFVKRFNSEAQSAASLSHPNIVSIYDDSEYNAGPKAKKDIEDILVEDNFEKISLKFKLNNSLRSKILKIKYKYIDIPLSLSKIEKNSIVFLQYPAYSSFILKIIIKKLKEKSKKLFYIVHDVESLRLFRDKPEYHHEERSLLNMADGLIVHNQEMRKWLIKDGITVPMVDIKVFDYLNDKIDRQSTSFDKSICFAGNLSKSSFLEEVETKYELDLYGMYPAKEYKNGVKYKGAYPPSELGKQLTQNFGLIWDGDSVEECNGIYGEYMQYNNPHKFSLYLSLGIPVIIWEKAALAKFVKKNNVGITIANLKDLDRILDNITYEKYKEMKKNSEEIGNSVRQGKFTKTAVEEIIRKVDNLGDITK